jgi:hypothetical protein
VLLRMAVLLSVVGLLLHYCRYRTTSRWMARFGRPVAALAVPSGWQPEAYAQRCAELASVAARHGLYEALCLPQALVLQCLLAQSGLVARLRIGVLPGSAPLQAHAWVEYENLPLGSQDVHAYRTFDDLAVPDLLLPH